MRRVILLIAALAAVSAPLQAQSGRPNRREGFWIGFGLGGGSAAADCTSCTTDRTSGLIGYFRLGGTVSSNVLLGVESDGWYHSENGLKESTGFGQVVLLWYPSRTGAFYIKVGAGGMQYKSDDGFDELTATAPSGSLGVGYEFRTGRNVSFVPFFNALATSSVSARFNGIGVPTNEDVKVNVMQLGIGVTFH